ncbi:MAG: taurine ABC transporter substrate-binding protein, partial [Burkholderiales bacterium]|nr:taurine ABC transporter substrate-binding protein [Burkholderiales bacterium]
EHPADLEGKSIGLQSFQTTLAVLAKGDLASEYGVPLDSIQWRVKRLDTVASAGSCRFDITLLADDLELADALAIGEIDALFYSRTP